MSMLQGERIAPNIFFTFYAYIEDDSSTSHEAGTYNMGEEASMAVFQAVVANCKANGGSQCDPREEDD